MSIDWLNDLERDLENGKEIIACPGMGVNDWFVGKAMEDTEGMAKRAANHKKFPVDIVRLVLHGEAIAGDTFLVPTQIGDGGPRGEPQIKWKVVETREAAEMLRDVRQGPSPFCGMQHIKQVQPG